MMLQFALASNNPGKLYDPDKLPPADYDLLWFFYDL